MYHIFSSMSRTLFPATYPQKNNGKHKHFGIFLERWRHGDAMLIFPPLRVLAVKKVKQAFLCFVLKELNYLWCIIVNSLSGRPFSGIWRPPRGPCVAEKSCWKRLKSAQVAPYSASLQSVINICTFTTFHLFMSNLFYFFKIYKKNWEFVVVRKREWWILNVFKM